MQQQSTQNLPFDLGRKGEEKNEAVKKPNSPYRSNQQNESTSGKLNRLRNRDKYRSKNKKPRENLPYAETIEDEFRNGTAIVLKGAWQAVSPSWGLSIFYVWFHFVIRYLAGNEMFARFGTQVKIPGSKIKPKTSKALELAYIIAALGLFLLFFFIIMIMLGLFGTILYMADNKWDTIKTFIGEGLSALWKQIKALF